MGYLCLVAHLGGKDMDKNEIPIIGCAVFLIGQLTIVTLAFSNWVDFMQCNAKYADFIHRWGIIERCLIRHDGKWIPDERFRVLDE